MRITGRQLRQIIKEEVENMMYEATPAAEETILVGPDGKVIDPDRDKRFYSDVLMMIRARGSSTQVIKAPSLADVRDTGPWDRVFSRLMAGETFSDRNADADAKLVINALIDRTIAANEPLRGRFQPTLPTSPFGSNLKVLQQILRIDADGILGLQSYFAILTGGVIDLPSDMLRKYSSVSKEIQKNLKNSAGLSRFFERIKQIGASGLGRPAQGMTTIKFGDVSTDVNAEPSIPVGVTSVPASVGYGAVRESKRNK